MTSGVAAILSFHDVGRRIPGAEAEAVVGFEATTAVQGVPDEVIEWLAQGSGET